MIVCFRCPWRLACNSLGDSHSSTAAAGRQGRCRESRRPPRRGHRREGRALARKPPRNGADPQHARGQRPSPAWDPPPARRRNGHSVRSREARSPLARETAYRRALPEFAQAGPRRGSGQAHCRPIRCSPMDLSGQSPRELLKLYIAVMDRLRALQLVRSANQPVGDVAELLVAKAYGVQLETQATRGYDLVVPDPGFPNGRRIEVKARRVSAGVKASHYSFLRGLGADHSAVRLACGRALQR